MVSPENKKALKAAYKEMKPQMGVFRVRNIHTGQCFVEASNDIQSMFNRVRFQLQMGMHPSKSLQADWKSHDEDTFAFEVLDTLEYKENSTPASYRDDLKMLKALWIEKLAKEYGVSLY